ncbi:efflux RND transporter periplasmic adaptor subunit [Rhodoferax antarcticus]|uniref:Efflux transporter, RND family, MFP subunit n=1 Tax=Rhodoferax antarcticus ANT.BR TaxID=1111071 RepID=A0A1Q8YBJ3_9BURK|nr:efflux RND transporter periplasmic adaptor subunit [Rhodoferax antarcticus]OLP05279.1 efflux transporter, RND family, MFP subunit [Rhodoferax antarcticus ANT.BR]
MTLSDLNRRSIWLTLLAIFLFAMALLTWWWRGTPVDAVVVQSQTLVRTLQFSARVASQTRVDVGSTLTGRVEAVLVLEGAAVKRGQVLLRLESQELSAAFSQAEAAERQAAARLEGLRSTGQLSARAVVSQAEAVARAAQAAWERTQQLVAQGFLSDAALDEARRARDVAQAQLANAQAQASASGERGSDQAQALAQLALAQAASQAAQARLAQADVLAPTDGRVLLREVEPGQIVQPGKVLLGLALASPVEIVAPVDERFLDQLRVGQSASVVADAFAEQRFKAQVVSIAPSVDAQRGSVEVKLTLTEAAPDFLREDMTVSVEVETARVNSAQVLPLAALRAASNTVLIDEAGRARQRSVRLGLRTLEAVEVVDGLSDGDQVLVGGSLQDGQRVRVRVLPWQPGQRAGGAAAPDSGTALINAMYR